MTAVPVTASHNIPSASPSSLVTNPAYSTRQSGLYDYIDDSDYEQPVYYQSLGNNPGASPQASSPSYDVLGPDYLRIIG